MKRQSIVLNPEHPDRPCEINWSNCCIDNTGDNLRSSDVGIESLAKQSVTWWKHGVLLFDAYRLSNSNIVMTEVLIQTLKM